MLQTHTMIFWSKASSEDFKDIVDKAYNTMMGLKEFGSELSPNYLTVGKKKDAKLFEWSYDGFKKVLADGVNKEGNNSFPELGYSISFFSSLNNKDSAGIRMTIGIAEPKFNNTLVVNLPQTLLIYDNNVVIEKLLAVFKTCVKEFKPFWGCIANDVNTDRFDGYFGENLPTTTHWINFWGKEIVNRMGINKFDSSPAYNVERLEEGYIVRLQENPIDEQCANNIDFQSSVNKYFGL